MFLPQLGGEEVRGPTSWGVPTDGTGTSSVECGGCEGASDPRHAKTSSPGRKMIPGPSHGGADEGEGEETSRSENETCLVPARQPGCEPGGLPQHNVLPGIASTAVQDNLCTENCLSWGKTSVFPPLFSESEEYIG
jgi:hypothetical protein